MELACSNEESLKNDILQSKKQEDYVVTSSNWEIENERNFNDCVSTVALLQAPDSTNLEDVVSLDTCVALKSDPSGESCKLEFKLTNNQKIARIAVVSEASVLEFFKHAGEYAATVFAEFVDEFQDHAVYFAEAKIEPPSTEAGIKFTRTKNKGTTMWLYGIKLVLTESVSETSKSMLDFDVINSFITNSNQIKPERAEMARKVLESFAANEHNSMPNDTSVYLQKLATTNWNSYKFVGQNKSLDLNHSNSLHVESNGDDKQNDFDLKAYIDDKFACLEKRLIKQIEIVDQKTNQKLDEILKLLELNVNR